MFKMTENMAAETFVLLIVLVLVIKPTRFRLILGNMFKNGHMLIYWMTKTIIYLNKFSNINCEGQPFFHKGTYMYTVTLVFGNWIGLCTFFMSIFFRKWQTEAQWKSHVYIHNARETLSRSWHPMNTRIWNFEFRVRTLSRANQQPKQVRCIKKVMRWHPNHTRLYLNHTRRQHKYRNFH